MYPDFSAPIRLRASGNTSHVHSSDVGECGLKPATTCLTVTLSQVCSRGLQPAFHHVSTAPQLTYRVTDTSQLSLWYGTRIVGVVITAQSLPGGADDIGGPGRAPQFRTPGE